MLVSACFSVPLYLRFKTSFSLAGENLIFTTVQFFVVNSQFFRDIFDGSGRFFIGRRVIFTSLSDQQ